MDAEDKNKNSSYQQQQLHDTSLIIRPVCIPMSAGFQIVLSHIPPFGSIKAAVLHFKRSALTWGL